ncbi:MAG: hypothetical protein LBC28_01515, partial [Oscillospiraceae bacterium]|nr:hypothetical protein [Oscillospiraceae bacterium]
MEDYGFFPIVRNRYFYGKLLTVRDFEAEQRYESVKRRLISRVVGGAGVVCGFGVTAGDDATLIIESGLAIDYLGRELALDEPLIRKLEMLDGHESLAGRDDAYLCLDYDETDIEPVNAVGSDAEDGREFNMTREGCRLYLTPETPDFKALLEARGRENVNVIYSTDGLTLALSAPAAVAGGEEFTVNVLMVKDDKTLPVSFTIEGENGFAETENGRLSFSYRESPAEPVSVAEIPFRVKAQSLSKAVLQLFPNGAELNVELGSHKYKNFIAVAAEVTVCATRGELYEHTLRTDSLERRLRGRDVPLYLAKLGLVASAGKSFIRSVINLPFAQKPEERGEKSGAEGGKTEFTASAKALEYWQKPDVRASVNETGDRVHLEFGIPAPENYDYATSHGVVEIATPGGVKVNARYFSDEIPHGLGAGNVEVRLAVEFDGGDGSGTAQLFGNSEVFRAKGMKLDPPWAETAVVVFPERGTMRIGLWLHDSVEGN